MKRKIGLTTATALVAANMIGTCVFTSLGFQVTSISSGFAIVALWLVGGLVALCGALVYGELGARIPRAGGDYQYLRDAFGPLWGFLTGWAAFVVSFSAAAAAMCKVSVSYAAAALAPEFLTAEMQRVRRRAPGNLDATVVAQAPRMGPYIHTMRENLAADLGVAPDQLTIKATTTEGLGFAGREEGIAAHAVVLLQTVSP